MRPLGSDDLDNFVSFEFETRDLFEKYGFEDGGVLNMAWVLLCSKYRYPGLADTSRMFLRECLRKLVFPLLDPPQEFPAEAAAGIYNPVVIGPVPGGLRPEVVHVSPLAVELLFCEVFLAGGKT